MAVRIGSGKLGAALLDELLISPLHGAIAVADMNDMLSIA